MPGYAPAYTLLYTYRLYYMLSCSDKTLQSDFGDMSSLHIKVPNTPTTAPNSP